MSIIWVSKMTTNSYYYDQFVSMLKVLCIFNFNMGIKEKGRAVTRPFSFCFRG